MLNSTIENLALARLGAVGEESRHRRGRSESGGVAGAVGGESVVVVVGDGSVAGQGDDAA